MSKKRKTPPEVSPTFPSCLTEKEKKAFVYFDDQQVKEIDLLLTKYKDLFASAPCARKHIIASLTPSYERGSWCITIKQIENFVSKWQANKQWWTLEPVQKILQLYERKQDKIEKALRKYLKKYPATKSNFVCFDDLEDLYGGKVLPFKGDCCAEVGLQWTLSKDIFQKGSLENVIKDPFLNEFYQTQFSID